MVNIGFGQHHNVTFLLKIISIFGQKQDTNKWILPRPNKKWISLRLTKLCPCSWIKILYTPSYITLYQSLIPDTNWPTTLCVLSSGVTGRWIVTYIVLFPPRFRIHTRYFKVKQYHSQNSIFGIIFCIQYGIQSYRG